MSTKILFVFEGEKTEKQILTNLYNYYINENTIVTCAYCNNLYSLYREIKEDDDLDTFSLLKGIPENKLTLKEFDRDDFAEIYLFFDYDGHDSAANDLKLFNLLGIFNEETEKGKLYISYPMVESLKHISDYDSFKDLKVNCKENIKYKNLVSENCLKELVHFNKYSTETWKKLIRTHLMKMNYVVNDSFVLPDIIVLQIKIFECQMEKYINIDSTVSVLNAFPIFLHDYYGNVRIKELIE